MGKKKKYKIRMTPINVYFVPCKDDKGNEWLEISLNGTGYPSVKMGKEISRVATRFSEYLEELGQEKIDKINKKIEKDYRKEMTNLNNNVEKREKKQSGFIYLLKSKNLYKIGRAKCPKDRLKTYKTENPFGIKVILQRRVDDYIKMEEKLLDMFRDKRVKGEWFKLNKQDIQWIGQNI